MSLATAIKRIRASKGMDQVDLVRKSGLSSGYLAQIETRKIKNPGRDKLKLIARGLGITVKQLDNERNKAEARVAFWASGEIPFARVTAKDNTGKTITRVLYGLTGAEVFGIIDAQAKKFTNGSLANGGRKQSPRRASRGRRSAS